MLLQIFTNVVDAIETSTDSRNETWIGSTRSLLVKNRRIIERTKPLRMLLSPQRFPGRGPFRRWVLLRPAWSHSWCMCVSTTPGFVGLRAKKSLATSYSPTSLQGSTIGAGGLNFRVRDGNGWDPSAVVTRQLFAFIREISERAPRLSPSVALSTPCSSGASGVLWSEAPWHSAHT